MKNACLLWLTLASFLVLTGCQRWSESSREETIISGQQIVEALGAYQIRNSKYPEKLAELVPTYIAAIPAPEAGNRTWIYEAGNSPTGPNFILRVEDDVSVSGNSLGYDSRSQRWFFQMDSREP